MPGLDKEKRLSQRLTLAQTCCLCLGFALILWGLAPAIVERFVTRRTPPLDSLMLGSASFIVGLAFVTLNQSVRRGARWALWVTFGTALLLATTSVVATFVASAPTPTIFPLILAGATVVTTWMGLSDKGTPPLPPLK